MALTFLLEDSGSAREKNSERERERERDRERAETQQSKPHNEYVKGQQVLLSLLCH